MTTTLLGTTAVRALVEAAGAAPSLRNAQPWRFVFLRDSATVRLYADRGRHLPQADAEERGLHLGCGAALFNLRVAAAAAGRDPVVRLLPDDCDGSLLAEVRLTDTGHRDESLARLHPAVARRSTSRRPIEDDELPAAVRGALCDVALREGARLVFPDALYVRLILQLVRDVEGGASPEAGVPSRERDFGTVPVLPGRSRAPFGDRPRIALLGTVHNRPVDWLTAGQALEHVLLLSTQHGLVTSLAFHPFEWPGARWTEGDRSSAMEHVHMVLHPGHGPQGTPAPRRPVAEVLEIM
ncbi:nitroreductase [Streptomyces sp. NPDC056160]|uniref:nitroreductase n=1 Tax=Streptomyces sp. NPDC056160 TaxID=3345731 RepID=UPI0035D642AB